MRFNSIKLVGGALIASGLLLTGCSDKTANTAADSSPSSAKTSVSARIPEGTSAAVIIRDNRTLDPVTAKIKGLQNVALLKEEMGLDNVQLRWAALTVGQINGDKAPDIGLAISFTHDAAKIVAGLEKMFMVMGQGKVFTASKFADLDGWSIDGKGKLPEDVKPCLASLDGEILLVGINQAMLENMIALYRDDKGGKDTSFTDISEQKDDVLGLKLTKIGATITKFISTRQLGKQIPVENASEIIAGLEDLVIRITAKDAALNLSVALKAANADDATQIRAPLQGGLAMVKSVASATIKEDKDLNRQADKILSVLDSLKVSSNGSTVELSAELPVDLLVFAIEEVEKNFLNYREDSQRTACISNLKQLEAASEIAKINGIKTPKMSDLVGKDKYIRTEPKCPSGGTYALPTTEDGVPTCTVEGHKIR